MSEQLIVPIDALKTAFDIVIRHVLDNQGPSVALEKDYFWAISSEDRYNVLQKPSDYTVGQLSESLSNLEAVVEDPDRAISYSLVWLSDVLRAIGETVVE